MGEAEDDGKWFFKGKDGGWGGYDDWQEGEEERKEERWTWWASGKWNAVEG